MADLFKATLETLYMVGIASLFTVIIGLPLGIVLTITKPRHLLSCKPIYMVLSYAINITRSLPFIILMIFIIPFTRLMVGTSIGTKAAIVPLIIAAIPFFARIVESALQEVDPGMIEAAEAMGAKPQTIILRVLLPEALPALVLGITLTVINLIGYSAMAGAVGGGGIGDLAIRYGYHRFRTDIMLWTIIILVILVQGIQTLGQLIAHKIINNRRR